MLRTEDLKVLKVRIAGYLTPTLSAYVNVNPANPENRNARETVVGAQVRT